MNTVEPITMVVVGLDQALRRIIATMPEPDLIRLGITGWAALHLDRLPANTPADGREMRQEE